MTAKDILKLVPTLQATSIVGANLKLLKKKKKKAKDFIEVGTGTIVGTALTKETADFVEGF